MALIQTDPTHRKYGVAALVGVLGGFVSAIIGSSELSVGDRVLVGGCG